MRCRGSRVRWSIERGKWHACFFCCLLAPPRTPKKVHRGTPLIQVSKMLGKIAGAATRLMGARL